METSHTKGENENEESIGECDARDISKNIATKTEVWRKETKRIMK